ncbi:uracil-DNA glycosylase [Sporosarcina gallistercoris]|uniref:Uracil-DNA glycosylase n=1 Tax=Sporosarcina gallistercoris TaxID=2762245 RepID=A0ABR8PKF1_9BACL|nr:uracil-DNA glycosylase [Sporosarcina gallistercoris]MBD7908660.1 uracil-DNA glycosylase [Sporosarcina gallistercoris]
MKLKPQFGSQWDAVLQEAFEAPSYAQLREFLKKEYGEHIVYPEMDHIWNAFKRTPYESVKVVILGQDPYHGKGQAHGLSFSVQPGVKKPPSLRNIFKELASDIGCSIPESGSLLGWAEQGVLLMNTVLTVREGEAHSHRKQGWEAFTDEVIRKLSDRDEPIVFILWGRPAQEKKRLIDLTKHVTIESVHPSPLSANRGFFGSRPFSKTNEQLASWGELGIDWCRTEL